MKTRFELKNEITHLKGKVKALEILVEKLEQLNTFNDKLIDTQNKEIQYLYSVIEKLQKNNSNT